jgi:hypothetical protein
MECGVSVKLPATLALWMCLVTCASAQTPGDLVLVTHESSPVTALSAGEVRRVFMGLTLSIQQGPIRPIINESSDTLRTAFLQHVVGLSEKMYQRRRLSLELQQGVTRPQAIRDQKQLVERLRGTPTGISFMWRGDVQRIPELRILRVIWAP